MATAMPSLSAPWRERTAAVARSVPPLPSLPAPPTAAADVAANRPSGGGATPADADADTAAKVDTVVAATAAAATGRTMVCPLCSVARGKEKNVVLLLPVLTGLALPCSLPTCAHSASFSLPPLRHASPLPFVAHSTLPP